MFWKLASILILLIIIYSGLPTFLERICARRKFTKSRKIALTFDDGPGIYTEEILDLLKYYDIKVSFFIVTDNAVEYPETMRRIIFEGHEICLHSKSHKSNLFKTYNIMNREFQKSIEDLNKFEIKPKFFRPPWGVFNLSMYLVLRKYHLKKVVWNVMIGDWSSRVDGDILYRRLLKKTTCGSVICIHDAGTTYGPKNTLEALKLFIPDMLDGGFEFINISEVFKEKR